MPQKQIKDQDDEQNTADADAAAVAVTRIAKTASEQEEQHDDYQDQIHWFPQRSGRQARRTDETPVVVLSMTRSSIQPNAFIQHQPFDVPCGTRCSVLVFPRSGRPR